MTNYITKRIQVIFSCVFKGILAYLVSGPKSIPELLLVFVEIMPDTVILDHKSHIWSILKIFIFCDFFAYGQFFLKIKKNKPKYEFLWSKMTLSDILNTKTSKSPGINMNEK